MKANAGVYLSLIVAVGALTMTGCGKKPEPPPGLAERTGAKIDKAAKKGAEKAEGVAEKAADKTGKILEKVGEAVDKAGKKLQK